MKNFQIGISTFCFSVSGGNDPVLKPDCLMTHMDILRTAVQLQVPVVQLCDNLGLDRLPEEKIDELAVFAEEHGLALEAGCYCDSEEKFIRYMDLCGRLHAHFLRIIPALPGDTEEMPATRSMLKNLSGEVRDRGLTVGLENCEHFSVSVYRHAAEDIDSPEIGLIVDTTNSIGRLETVDLVLKEMAPFAVGLHLKDMTAVRKPGKLGFVMNGTPLGEGLLDIPAVIECVRREARQDFSCILENWTLPAEDGNHTAAREMEWTKKNVSYLKEYQKEHV